LESLVKASDNSVQSWFSGKKNVANIFIL
jgi:hypothetical protein